MTIQVDNQWEVIQMVDGSIHLTVFKQTDPATCGFLRSDYNTLKEVAHDIMNWDEMNYEHGLPNPTMAYELLTGDDAMYSVIADNNGIYSEDLKRECENYNFRRILPIEVVEPNNEPNDPKSDQFWNTFSNFTKTDDPKANMTKARQQEETQRESSLRYQKTRNTLANLDLTNENLTLIKHLLEKLEGEVRFFEVERLT